MTTLQAPPPWLDVGPHRFIPGFVRGRHQPSLLVGLRLARGAATEPLTSVPPPHKLQALAQLWREVAGAERVMNVSIERPDDWQAWVRDIGACVVALMRGAGLPLFDEPQWLRLPRLEQAHVDWSTVLLPVMPGWPTATWQAWLATVQSFELLAQTDSLEPLRVYLGQTLLLLRGLVFQGANTPRFLRAAHERGVPVIALGRGAFQYGHGRRAQWLDSTFTLRTANISVKLARDKQATSARLRQACLPVPDHQQAADADHAVRVANRLGYPVVIKPADQDCGKGVAARLETDAEVRAAFDQAKALSARILVEKHVEGRDYRLTVLDGELLWAIERIPAGVTGDGAQTIEQLVAKENTDPTRGDGPHAALRRLVLDDEARQLLYKQGWSAEAIPPKDQFVALRRIANVASGGRPVPVKDLVHPDNALLAVRAAEALRLDLAGVDLLIRDIARSWRESGAAICEVNAQPQLGATTGPHLYGEILQKRLRGDGRIPVVVVVGAKTEDTLTKEIVQRLQEQGQCVGWYDRWGAGVDGECLTQEPIGTFAAGQMLLTHPRVEAIVLGLNNEEVLRLGLPVDRIDCLVLAGGNFARPHMTETPAIPAVAALFNEVLSCVLPACAGRVIHLRGSGLLVSGLEKAVPACCTIQAMDREELFAALL